MLTRKNIMADTDIWNQLELIRLYQKKTDPQASISKIINEAVKQYIETLHLDELDLSLKLYSKPMSSAETKESNEILQSISTEDSETAEIIELNSVPSPSKEELEELIKWANK